MRRLLRDARARAWPPTAATLTSASTAHARGPYLVVRDDRTLREGRWTSGSQLRRASRTILAAVDDAGLQRPEVLSIWSTFPVKGSAVETVYDGFANDVTNIGLASVYDPETFSERAGPVAALWHDDVTQIARRAAFGLKPEGYASYLFLLELSHLWGPQLRAPAPTPDALVGFTFHWSFWMDAGGSPAGGNRFRDHGDGTFTVEPRPAAAVTFSMLDLYLMGLASADEVPPVGLLVDPVVPEGVKDPMGQRPVGAATFPWFDGAPFTVRATKRTYTMAIRGGQRRPPRPHRRKGILRRGLRARGARRSDGRGARCVGRGDDARRAESVARFAEATRGRVARGHDAVDAARAAEAERARELRRRRRRGSASPARAAPPAPPRLARWLRARRSLVGAAERGGVVLDRPVGFEGAPHLVRDDARRSASRAGRPRGVARRRARTLGGVHVGDDGAEILDVEGRGAVRVRRPVRDQRARAHLLLGVVGGASPRASAGGASPKASSTPGTSLRSGSASPERSRSTAWAARPGVEAARVTRSTSRQGTKRGRRPSARRAGRRGRRPPRHRAGRRWPRARARARARAPLRLAPVARRRMHGARKRSVGRTEEAPARRVRSRMRRTRRDAPSRPRARNARAPSSRPVSAPRRCPASSSSTARPCSSPTCPMASRLTALPSSSASVSPSSDAVRRFSTW